MKIKQLLMLAVASLSTVEAQSVLTKNGERLKGQGKKMPERRRRRLVHEFYECDGNNKSWRCGKYDSVCPN